MNRYSVVPDPKQRDLLAVQDTESKEFVLTGIKSERGKTSWAIARELRDQLNSSDGSSCSP